MDPIRKVDHVAIAVPSIAETVPLFFDALGGEFLAGGDNDETGIRLVHLRLPGLKLELMQPLRVDSFLQRHLQDRGPGFHHLTFFVDNLATTVTELDGRGFRMTGADFSSPAWQEAFMSPPASFGALLQFVETTLSWDVPAPNCTLDDALAGRVVWREYRPCLREEAHPIGKSIQAMREPVHSVDSSPENSAIWPLELLRSRRQAELLAIILAEPETEFPLSALAKRLDIPYSSVHREVERAERSGVVTSRRFANLRLVRANVASPHYESLARLFGSPGR